MGRLGLGLGLVIVLRQGLGLALGLQLRIGIGFRRNNSWSSTFTPRRNHSLCRIVATFTPRRSHISGARFTRSQLLASRLPAGRRSAPWDRAMAGLLLCVDSLLNRCYLLVSRSVRVRRGVGRLGLGLVLVLRLGLGLALGLQLGIGIGFRRNHSWSSTFTPRRNHSLCLYCF